MKNTGIEWNPPLMTEKHNMYLYKNSEIKKKCGNKSWNISVFNAIIKAELLHFLHYCVIVDSQSFCSFTMTSLGIHA